MSPSECNDRIRFSLSDRSGDLRFESFEIVGVPECRAVEQRLQRYLVGRPLATVDRNWLLRLDCPGNGACVRTLVRLIEEHQALFLRADADA